jgi:ankyrin repeat protein
MLLKDKSDPQPAELQQVWHPAIHHGRLNQIKALIALESVSRCDWVKENSTGLHIASREGRKSTFAHVLNDTMKQGCSLDLQDSRGRTALMLAASEGHAVVVDKLLKAGADASIQDNDPRAPHTALHWACIRGHSRAMEKLYDSKKLPEQTQLELMSLAVSHGHTTVVAIFQAAGLESVQVVEAHNMSVLEVAVQWNQAGVVAQLLEQSGNLITKHHVEALHLAAALGSPGVVNKLVVAGVSVDARDEKMWTPLMKAASRGSVKAAQSLVDLGAAISAVDSNGANASMIAMRHEQKSAGLLQLIQPDGWTVVEEDTSVDLKDNTPTLQITELTNANFDEHVITSPGGIFMVLFTMGGSGDSESAEALKKFEQAAAEAHGLAKFGIIDAGGLSNGPLRRRWDIERFPSILVFRPNQRGEKGTTEGPRLFEGDLTSEAIFDSVMELNYEAQRAIRLEEAQAKENEQIDVELTHPKKAGSIADQLGYSSDEPVEGRVDDEL